MERTNRQFAAMLAAARERLSRHTPEDIAVRCGKRRLIAGGGRQLVPTHFLSWASKKENALQKKEDAKENPSEGFSLDSFPNRGAAAPQTPRGAPLTRTFAEQKCLVTAKDSKPAARQSDCAKIFQTGTVSNRKRECSDICEHSRLEHAINLELQGFQKGRSPFVEAARAAQQLPGNFFAAARHRASFRR